MSIATTSSRHSEILIVTDAVFSRGCRPPIRNPTPDSILRSGIRNGVESQFATLEEQEVNWEAKDSEST